jgi:hypothetical protein
MGKLTISTGPFSIAMFVYQRVHGIPKFLPYGYVEKALSLSKFPCCQLDSEVSRHYGVGLATCYSIGCS